MGTTCSAQVAVGMALLSGAITAGQALYSSYPGMTCPQCSSTLLFGATTCPCGYTQPQNPASPARSLEDRAIELSYSEALRAYWRLYWPSVVFVLIVSAVLRTGTSLDTYVPGLLFTVALFLFVSRITTRRYRDFWFVVRQLPSGEENKRMSMSDRWDIFSVLWWKQLLPFGIAAVATTMLGSLGITQWAAGLILQASIVMLIGPMIVKSMIVDPFETFQILVRREE